MARPRARPGRSTGHVKTVPRRSQDHLEPPLVQSVRALSLVLTFSFRCLAVRCTLPVRVFGLCSLHALHNEEQLLRDDAVVFVALCSRARLRAATTSPLLPPTSTCRPTPHVMVPEWWSHGWLLPCARRALLVVLARRCSTEVCSDDDHMRRRHLTARPYHLTTGQGCGRQRRCGVARAGTR